MLFAVLAEDVSRLAAALPALAADGLSFGKVGRGAVHVSIAAAFPADFRVALCGQDEGCHPGLLAVGGAFLCEFALHGDVYLAAHAVIRRGDEGDIAHVAAAVGEVIAVFALAGQIEALGEAAGGAVCAVVFRGQFLFGVPGRQATPLR